MGVGDCQQGAGSSGILGSAGGGQGVSCQPWAQELVLSFNQSTREAIVPDSQAGAEMQDTGEGVWLLGPLWLDP